MLLLALGVASPSAHAATQVGSAPYKVSATGAGNSYAPVFSADGQHVAFVSHANNLVTNDDFAPHLDLFVRDLMTSNTVLVSVSTNGFGGANDNIGLHTLSSNASVLAFETPANNLAPGDTNRWRDIYVRDLASGATRLITPGANGPSSNPLISEDGRRVIFESLASNLVTNDFNGTNDIFTHDLTTGVTELVTLNAAGTASPDGPSHSPSISADGLTVAFVSHATNLVEGVTNTFGEVYARNITAGTTRWAVAAHLAATMVRSAASGIPGPFSASEPKLAGDGRLVAFKTLGSTVRFDLERPTNTVSISYTNARAGQIVVDSLQFNDNPRLGGGSSMAPMAMTLDGRFLLFETTTNVIPHPGLKLLDFDTLATNVIPVGSGGNGSADPNLTSYVTNISPTLKLYLTNTAGSDGSRAWSTVNALHLSQDGSRAFFVADATNLVEQVTNRMLQTYSLETGNGAVSLLSTNSSGKPLGRYENLSISAGSPAILIAAESFDDTLAPDDLNRAWDVFVRNVDTGETTLVSARHPDMPAATATGLARVDSASDALSENGQRLATLSLDSTQLPDDTNRVRDLFLLDVATGTKLAAPRPFSPDFPFQQLSDNAASPDLSSDGRHVAYAIESISTIETIRALVWLDSQSPTNPVLVARSRTGNSPPAISADGRLVAFHSPEPLDSRYADVNSANDVFLRLMTRGDFVPCGILSANSTPWAISLGWSRTQTGNGASSNPVFSPDSRWLLFQSFATVLMDQPLPAQNFPQLYARSIHDGSTTGFDCTALLNALSNSPTLLLSYRTVASTNAAGRSTETPLPDGAGKPRFSADSRHVFFESAPVTIYRHDLSIGYIARVTSIGGVSYTNYARPTNDVVCTNCAAPFPSGDGRFVAYESRPGTGGITNVFLKNLVSGQVELISTSMSGTNGNASSFNPLMTRDARFVVFASRASDLVPGDDNRATDIFVRDRWAGATHCLSRNFAGTGTGNRLSSNPILSADGRTVAFQSFASDLVPGDYNDTRDVFVVSMGGPDADGDGMEDDWEMAYFNTLTRDGSGDFDNDGASDFAEFRAGTNPANNASILRVLRFTMSQPGGQNGSRTVVLLWSAVPGKTYQVESKADLNAPWQPLGAEVVATGTSASATFVLDNDDLSAQPSAFHRVTVAQ